MSRRTIAHAERHLETHTNKSEGGTWTTVSYVPQGKQKAQRRPYGLFATAGDKPKFIGELSGRFGRAFRKARRDGQFYPKAFMSHYTPGGEGFTATPIGERFYIGEQKYLRGQYDARRVVTAIRTVDWDSKNIAGETLGDVMVDIIRERAERGVL